MYLTLTFHGHLQVYTSTSKLHEKVDTNEIRPGLTEPESPVRALSNGKGYQTGNLTLAFSVNKMSNLVLRVIF
jgi:hypothetical protein